MPKFYTTKDVAGLLGLSRTRVRSWARAGLLTPERGPRGAYRFSFQDLVLLRTARGLMDARIPHRRIRAALAHLRERLPEGRSLSELHIAAEGDRVVVHDGSVPYEPLSGQVTLDFSVGDLAAKVAPLAPRVPRAPTGAEAASTAHAWFETGLELEAYAPAEARAAYGRALEVDADHVEARVNLGRLLHDTGEVAAAADHYRAALERSEHPTAAFNLGVALEDLGALPQAVRAYQRALAADPGMADAHYNLARLFEDRGEQAAAIRHLGAYRRLAAGRG